MSDETHAVVERFHNALNSHDIDALSPLVHEEYISRPPTHRTAPGTSAELRCWTRAGSSSTSPRRRDSRWRTW